MAMLFCVAAAATPVLGVHEAVEHVHGHHHHDDADSGYGIKAAPHSHGEHEHSRLTEARVSMRGAHNDCTDFLVLASAVTSLHGYHAPFREPARPASRPPRCRDPLTITTVLRI